MAYEAARILHHMGCEVRVFDPSGLPVKDEVNVNHPKVQELRQLSNWSEAQFWSSPEQHGNITAVMKNQSEWSVACCRSSH
jgi:arsenic resistance protein ArsH